MSNADFPVLNVSTLAPTRETLHAYARILGALLKVCRKRRKHWWHASLRPSLRGLTTGIVHGAVDFEIELDLFHSRLRVQAAEDYSISEALTGQPPAELASTLKAALAALGAGDPLAEQQFEKTRASDGYSREQAAVMQLAIIGVAAAMVEFRAGIREETSPIQLWPHHFDLSMIWLPGNKVPGIDSADEESADKQMNFGFTFGDSGIAEPYFYITAYPLPDTLPGIALPGPARWHSGGFNGAVLIYKDLIEVAQPRDYLLELWTTLLEAGKAQML